MKIFSRRAVRGRILGFLYIASIVCAMLALAIYPDRYVTAALDGLKIWAVTVAPSLLPFFFLTALLTKTKAVSSLAKRAEPLGNFLYGGGGLAVYLQAMSFLSGYPIGAKTVADLYLGGAISGKEAEKLSVVSSTSGPLFIVGGIGVSMFGDKKVGLIILISHYLSSVFCGVVFRNLGSKKMTMTSISATKCENVLYESIYSSVLSVAIVGGFIAVFYTLARIALDAGAYFPIVSLLRPVFGEPLATGIAIGITECTTGIKLISTVGVGAAGVGAATALVTLGGVSVWCQSAVYLGKAKVRISVFALSKIIGAAFAFAAAELLFVVFY